MHVTKAQEPKSQQRPVKHGLVEKYQRGLGDGQLLINLDDPILKEYLINTSISITCFLIRLVQLNFMILSNEDATSSEI